MNASPAVILVRPQLGENIGMVARAMANFALADLRLVAPRDGWPSETARAAASGADRVIDAARVYDSPQDAIADLGMVLATTARPRDSLKPVVDPVGAVARLRPRIEAGEAAGLMFGAERSGLSNDEVALCDAVITFPTAPDFASLNLAQSVLLMGYEWYRGAGAPAGRARRGDSPPPPLASKDDMARLFAHLEAELDAGGFLHPPEKRPNMVRNLRNIFLKAGLTEPEVRTLRGVIRALARER